eukprot:CAMPEP_0196772056 /NCGR_PEP_ID=MMETSP1104-20130614/2019_1 /TAXON_ID=33652 /ORGANISM="Cafeteria sp., Strain Caron Lab Isolate" /LENGTH=531 /DNA_ID=CAMNT_0042142187 /DNA_START=116 /DNA_END=1711 /DNA_ORIENTATION=-
MADAKAIRLFLLTMVMFCHLFTFTLLLPVEPQYVADIMGGDEPLKSASFFLGWITACRSALEFLSNPIFGSLSDCYGRRPFILLALSGTVLENVLKGLFPNEGVIAGATISTGSVAMCITVCLAYIADTDPRNVSKNFGLVGVALGFAFVSGPVIGGTLGVENIKAVYFIAAGVELVGIAIVLVVLTESLAPEKRAEFTLSRINPLSVFHVLLRTRFILYMASVMFFLLLAQNLNVVWSLYTKYKFDWSSTELGIFLGVVGLVAVLSNGILLRIMVTKLPPPDPVLSDERALSEEEVEAHAYEVERRQRQRDFHSCAVAILCSIFALFFFGLATHSWMLYVILVFAAVGITADPAMRGLLSKHTPPKEQGELQGAISGMHTIARVIGPLLATSLFGWFISDDMPVKVPGAPFFLFSFTQCIALGLLMFKVTVDGVADVDFETPPPAAVRKGIAGAGAAAGAEFGTEDEHTGLLATGGVEEDADAPKHLTNGTFADIPDLEPGAAVVVQGDEAGRAGDGAGHGDGQGPAEDG